MLRLLGWAPHFENPRFGRLTSLNPTIVLISAVCQIRLALFQDFTTWPLRLGGAMRPVLTNKSWEELALCPS